MRKHLVLFLIFYTLGIIVSPAVNSEYALYFGLAFVVSAVIYALFFKGRKHFSTCVISFVASVLITGLIGQISIKPYYDFINVNSDVVCQVTGPAQKSYDNTNYPVKFIKNGKRAGGTILMLVDNNYTGEKYSYGDTLLIKNAKIVPYTDFKNSYYTSNGYFSTIKTADYNIEKQEKVKISKINEFIFSFRNKVISVCDKYLSSDAAAFVKAITVGDKDGISKEVSDDFSNSGLSHLLSISGFHLSLIIGSISLFISGKKSGRYVLPFVQIAVCIFMIIITGGQYSIVRASVMFIIMSLSNLVYREYDSYTSLLISGGIIIILNPFSVYNAGFLMSFFATLGIIVLSPKINEFLRQRLKMTNKYFSETIAVSLSAQIFVMPITAFVFNKIQLLSVFANIIAVPVFALLLAVSIVFAVVGIIIPVCTPIFAGIIFLSYKTLFYIAHITALIPFSCVDVSGINFLIKLALVSSFFISVYVFKVSKKLYEKIISIVLASVVIISIVFTITGRDFAKVTFLDVGQGDCALIEVYGKNILIDGGTSDSEYDIGEEKIKPYLLRNEIKSIDYAVISHYHEDHYLGILYLLNNFDIKTLILSGASNPEDETNKRTILDAAKKNDVPVYYFFEGDSVKLGDDASLTVYSPLRNVWYRSNDESLVIKFNAGNTVFLFTGDIETSGEKKLITKDLSADVLKVAHHGSHSSSDEKFLQNVGAKFAVISCGKNNMYGHPHSETLEKLKMMGTTVFRTDLNGDIVFHISDNGRMSVDLED